MAKTLEQILGAKNLTGVITAVKGGVPEVMPPAFFRPTRTVEGNKCTYRKVEGTRQTARLVQWGAPSVNRGLKGVSEVPVTLLHSKEHIFHDPYVLMNLQNYANESKQKLGQAEIARQTGEFKRLFTNLRVSTIMSALCLGLIYFDADGNLLPNSTGATVSVDFGIPAGNKNQLDVFGAGAIIGASWATAGTGIAQDIVDLKKAALQLTGYPLKYAFYGPNLLSYFLTNTQLKEIINRTPRYQASFSQNEIADPFLGLTWLPLYESFYVDKDNTVQTWAGNDMVVFTPEISPDWWEMVQGSSPVPSTIYGSVATDGGAAMGSVKEAAGMFSYGQVLADPVTVKHVAGDTFLPLIKVPKAVFIADVTP